MSKDKVQIRDNVKVSVTANKVQNLYPCPKCKKPTIEIKEGWRRCSDTLCGERICIMN